MINKFDVRLGIKKGTKKVRREKINGQKAVKGGENEKKKRERKIEKQKTVSK